MTAPSVRMISRQQAEALRMLHGQLGRPCPELVDLTWDQAGDLIIELRAELMALTEGTDTR